MGAGNVSFAYSNFLGYKKTEKGIEIDKDEEPIVKMIYREFLVYGKSCHRIANELNEAGIPTPTKKGKKWTTNNIVSILTNEKYYGDALLQKTYISDYLEHKPKKNNGEIEQYYVTGSQPAIINRDEWDLVQFELQRRRELGIKYSRKGVLAGKIICGDCGSFYGKKVWHSTDKYRCEVFQCNHKFKDKCQTPTFSEEEIKAKFLKALSGIIKDKARIIKDADEICELLTDSTNCNQVIEEAKTEMEVVNELLNKEIDLNSRTKQDQATVIKRHEELVKRYQDARSKIESARKEKSEKRAKALKITQFIENLTKIDLVIPEWSDEIWNSMVERAIVNRDESITFEFKNGKEVKINATE